MAKKKPYAPPKLSRYESQREKPIALTGAAAEGIRSEIERRYGLQVAPDYTTVVDTNRRYIEVSDSFCQLVGYGRQDLIGKTYDELSAPSTNDIPTVFALFVKNGYMHGLWMLVHRTGTRILVRYEAWVRPDCQIQSNMELVGSGYGEAKREIVVAP
jgi:PAS domain S-box-containing protein